MFEGYRVLGVCEGWAGFFAVIAGRIDDMMAEGEDWGGSVGDIPIDIGGGRRARL